MLFVSTVQSQTITKSFAFDIPNFVIQAEAISKSSRVISSPEFSFDGLENEKYEGNISVSYSNAYYLNGASRINFSVKLSTAGCVAATVDVASTISVSIHSITRGVISVLGEKTETNNFIQTGGDGNAFSDYVTKPLADLKKSCHHQDEVRVSVTLTLLYTYNKDDGWKLENSLADFSPKRIRPCYDEPLTKRKKTDVTIECGGGEFPVHSLVLKLVSPVFERMLETNMEEATSRRITIDDVEPEAIERMINFIYTNKLFSARDKPSDESIIQLLHCAEKYGIVDMKSEVLYQILRRLTVTNAIRYVEAIKTYYGDQVALAKALEFCKTNLACFPKDSVFEKFLLENIQALISE